MSTIESARYDYRENFRHQQTRQACLLQLERVEEI
jgi:hypothetical protein